MSKAIADTSIFRVASKRITDLEMLWTERGRKQRKITLYTNKFIYIYSYSLSFFCASLEEVITKAEDLFYKANIDYSKEILTPVVTKAFDDGKKFIVWFEKNGSVITYAEDDIVRPYRTETIIKQLNISKREEAKMMVLVNGDTKRARKRVADASRIAVKRLEAGVLTRESYVNGLTYKRIERGLQALQMLRNGATKKAVSEKLGITRPTLDRWLKDATENKEKAVTNKIYNMPYQEGIKLIKDSSVNVLFTDPPYGLNLAEWDRVIDYDEFFSLIAPKVKSGGAVLMFCSHEMIGPLSQAMGKNNIKVRRLLVWRKTNAFPIKNSYQFALEHILYGVKGSGSATYKLPAHLPGHDGVFEHSAVERDRWHFAQKPLKLLEEILEIHSNSYDTVLDPFSGSGSISVIAKMMRRNSIGFEISEEYYKKSVDRLENVK